MNLLRRYGAWALIALTLGGTFVATQLAIAKDVREWSTTAGSNNDASPDGFPEGMAPSGVNNSAREAMAAIAEVYQTTYGRNVLINGDFQVAQRGTSFTSATSPANNDDTYLLDRWTLLSNGNDIVDVSQDTSVVPTGAYAAIKLDVETANAKFGIIQFVETRNAKALIGGTGSLQFKARITGTTINAIRAGAMCWSGTADTLTSDVVSAWGVAGTNPTLVANWTFENTPAALTAPTTSFQTYRIESISFDTASCTNIAVFIWTDDVTMDVGDFLYIADVQLEPGPVATNFERTPYSAQLSRAQRYLWRVTSVAGNEVFAAGYNNDTTTGQYAIQFPVQMRVAPTFSVSNVADFIIRHGTTNTDTTNLVANTLSTTGADLLGTVSAGLTAGQGSVLKTDAAAKWFEFIAEL